MCWLIAALTLRYTDPLLRWTCAALNLCCVKPLLRWTLAMLNLPYVEPLLHRTFAVLNLCNIEALLHWTFVTLNLHCIEPFLRSTFITLTHKCVTAFASNIVQEMNELKIVYFLFLFQTSPRLPSRLADPLTPIKLSKAMMFTSNAKYWPTQKSEQCIGWKM